jgi:hypothetical protein
VTELQRLQNLHHPTPGKKNYQKKSKEKNQGRGRKLDVDYLCGVCVGVFHRNVALAGGQQLPHAFSLVV